MARNEFDGLIADKMEATGREVDRLLAECKVSKDDIDRVVLAGGSTRIPKVSALLREKFGFAPNNTLEPDKAIAMGAAIYAALRTVPGHVQPKKLLPIPVGLKVTRRTFESIVGEIGHEGEERNAFEEVLPRGLPCPGEATRTVTTVRHNQQKLMFQIYQNNGEEGAGLCQPHDFMGWFELTLPQAARGPKGVPQVAITFSINEAATMLDVWAVEALSGQKVDTHLVLGQLDVEPPPEDSGGSGIADVVFVVDTTGSMGSYIDGMKRRVNEFASKLGESGIDYRLALVDFRDLRLKERLNVHPFETNVAAFKRLVDTMGPGGGGDEPESALDGLEAALGLSFRPEAQKIFVLITDASTHDPSTRGTSLKQVGTKLKEASVAMYVVSMAHHLSRQYRQLIDATEIGRPYEMGQPFDDILDGIVSDIRDVTLA
jgi:Mg-chelatase subunit ChlD